MGAEFDLNLVRTFVLLYETRSVTAAADVLGVTQPTVSYGLGKLRRRLGDELFVRGPGGLVPSSEAERLYPPLRTALEQMDLTIGATKEFDVSGPISFAIGLTDLGEVNSLPRVLAELTARAPAASLQVRAFDIDTATDELTRGRVDAIVATPILDSARLSRLPLFTEGYAGMVAADHPRLQSQAPTDAELRAERHIVVDGATGHPAPRHALRAHGLERRIAVRVTRFATLPYVVQDSELVAIVPQRVARALARTHPVRTFALPWQIDPAEVAAYTRRPPGRSPAQTWFLDVIRTALQDLP
ncbi:LysR family transcriptional regulator [Nocardia brasiliensis]|uniref:LysR family transcriptional regulator n=1 Tax=Nocardia brasiliensis (strain ATCC 700358 / HUJEG-1) TaxID=1133849 RepID=K0EXW7_NOCB7|nr:LysR family transcriptional regulator [Nocardia brasiliensis]AFU02317.1 LysR family transcriptional regulator [Nocardia brasiliensis ATCC 700358]